MDMVLSGLEGSSGEARVGKERRQPVHRSSRLRGRFEGVFWRPFAPKDVGRFLLAAERFERAGKRPGSRSGPLGVVAIEVLRELLRLVDYRTGRLEPALTTLMARTRRSKDAVVRALQALRRHGFLDWVRRCEPTGNSGKGPQVRQVSNAYRLALPPAAERLLGRLGAGAPVPEDLAHAAAERRAAFAAMIAAADVEERNGVLFGAGPLADVFSRFERAVGLGKERESAKRTESSQRSFFERSKI